MPARRSRSITAVGEVQARRRRGGRVGVTGGVRGLVPLGVVQLGVNVWRQRRHPRALDGDVGVVAVEGDRPSASMHRGDPGHGGSEVGADGDDRTRRGQPGRTREALVLAARLPRENQQLHRLP